MSKSSIAGTKALASILGVAMVAPECWLNADYIAQGGNWAQPMVLATLVITIAGAAALPIAERVGKSGQPAKALALACIFFPIVAAFSFATSTERSGARRDAIVANHQATAENRGLSAKIVKDAENIRDRECANKHNGTTACKRAEIALTGARNGLKNDVTTAAQALEDGAVARLATLLSALGVSERGLQLYLPLLMPFALLSGGFLFLAVGFAPGREPPASETPVKAEIAPAARAVSETEALTAVIKLVMAAHERKLSVPSRGKLAEMVGAAPTSMKRWLKKWDGDKLVLREDGGQIILALATIRRVA